MVERTVRTKNLSGAGLLAMTPLEFRGLASDAGLTDARHLQVCEMGLRSLRGDLYKVSYARIMRFNRPEWALLAIGTFFATCHGGVMPGFALTFSTMLSTFYLCVEIPRPGMSTLYGADCLDPQFYADNMARCEDEGECLSALSRDANFLALMFFVIAVATAIINVGQLATFLLAGEKMTVRVRAMLFRAMARQPISFFDREKNTSGALAARLADDAAKVQGATGSGLGTMIQGVMTGVVGFTIGFVISWRLALVICAIMPIMGLGAKLQMNAMMSQSGEAKENFAKAGSIASEAISGARTVASLGMQKKVQDLFAECLVEVAKDGKRKGTIGGFGFAFGHFTMFLAYFISFTVAATWIEGGTMKGSDVLKTFFVLVFTTMGMGQVSAFAPNLAEGKQALSYAFELDDTISEIDPTSQDGDKPAARTQGHIEFKAVDFAYPSRPDTQTLKSVSIEIQPGQKVALVGASGSGKSTCIALLERWYNPAGGGGFLDGKDVRSLNIQWLRRRIALVSQEPVLFDGTIYENIAFGDASLPKV
uniref:ABC transmembrane type-1 domain-containing protein n=1 Tax=Hemiselmis andersenii TaxID=464988 RepID=A0A7S1E3B9_HEMAN